MNHKPHWIVQIPFNTTIIVILSIIYCIAPPLLSVYVLDITLFKQMEFLKLIVFSTCIGAVIFSLNYVMMYLCASLYMFRKEIKNLKENKDEDVTLLGIQIHEFVVVVILCIYTFVAVVYFLSYIIDGDLPNIIYTLRISQGIYLGSTLLYLSAFGIRAIFSAGKLLNRYKEELRRSEKRP